VTDGTGVTRRAPRLAPDERIAPYVTRRGRFARLDPAVGRPLPAISKVLASVAWAVLLGESYRRARASTRAART